MSRLQRVLFGLAVAGVVVWVPWQGFLLVSVYQAKGNDVEAVLSVLQPLTLVGCCAPVGAAFLLGGFFWVLSRRLRQDEPRESVEEAEE